MGLRVPYQILQSKIDASIIVQLEEIGLEWSEWDSRYEELSEFEAQHVDCMVAKREEFKGLNQWMMTQHQNYKIPGKLSQERIIKFASDNYDGAHLYSFTQCSNHTLLQSK
jgi:hypothetical protein